MASDERGFQTRKSELEERLERLEKERTNLIEEVTVLREKRMLLDLEKKARTLQVAVDQLLKEKEDLAAQIASFGGQGQG
jgi:uncharacterized coiled-coil DUF342 family protein